MLGCTKHMVAIGGNIEAAVTMADCVKSITSKKPSSKKRIKFAVSNSPRLAAAAHLAMDQLMIDPLSHGIVIPFHDKHMLHKIHLHSSITGSKLDNDNQPDKSRVT